MPSIAHRPVVTDGETTPQRPTAAATGRESAQGGMIGPMTFDEPHDLRQSRWGPPPPPDEWRDYWARKRHERDWYPEYSGPERDYYDAPGRASGVYRSQSRRGPAVVYRLPRGSYQGPERGSFEGNRGPPRGPKDDVEEYFDSEDEIVTYGGRGMHAAGGGRSPPNDPTVMSEQMR